MSMTLDAPVQPGPVTGRLTARGVGCGAENEPLTGTWDGSTLRVESKVYPNVNVQRMNAQCGSGRVTYTLTRKPGQSTFEGEGVRDGMTGAAQSHSVTVVLPAPRPRYTGFGRSRWSSASCADS
jgi:hypothetical protein